MIQPNYYDNSIVNLMASLSAAQGGKCTDYPPLALIKAEEISPYKKIMLLVIDGLGDNTLHRLRPTGFLARHRLGRMTSVCPTTTASAISSYTSGKAPLQHGLTGWFTWLRELGTVAAVLPFRSRYGGPPLQQSGLSLGDVLGWSSVFDAFDRPVTALLPKEISNSHYGQQSMGSARQLGFRDLPHCLQLATEILEQAGPQFVYAYWSELDRLGHGHGIHSPEVAEHVAELEQAIEGFAAGLPTDCLLLISADHGLVDTDGGHSIALEQHPRLQQLLSIPLCGEPRFAFCYVQSDRHGEFEEYVQQHLSHACDLLSREQMLAMGLFGLGRAHPEFNHRIGDYALSMKGNYIIKDRVLGEHPYTHIGVHGGLSEDELYVPLIRISR